MTTFWNTLESRQNIPFAPSEREEVHLTYTMENRKDVILQAMKLRAEGKCVIVRKSDQ